MMKPQLFSRKIRQFKAACSELETQIKAGTSNKAPHLNSLVIKIKKLAKELAQAFNWSYVKRAMGSAAFLFGVVYSNQAVAQHFLEPLENPFSLESTSYIALPAMADLDGDGDFDLLAYGYYGAPSYHENIGTPSDPVFNSDAELPSGVGSAYYIGSPAFADIDNDGDMDLFVGEYYGSLLFFENIGTPTSPEFAEVVDNPFGFSVPEGSYFVAPTLADLDGDGDLDLLVSNVGYYGAEMIYFANEGTADSPLFGKPNPNPFGIEATAYLSFPQLVDLDQDGDLDIMAGNNEGSFIFQENIGTATAPEMGEPVENLFNLVNTYYVSACALVDLDDDGDLDLLAGEYYGNFQYFENAPELNIGELNKLVEVTVFPNPSSDFITVKSSETISQIELVDALGRTAALISNITGSIDVSHLDAGNYVVKVTLKSGEVGVSRFVKE